jgi:hypothetical protein
MKYPTAKQAERVIGGLVVAGLLALGWMVGGIMWQKARAAEDYAKRFRNTEVNYRELSDLPDGPVSFIAPLDGDPAGLVIGYAERYERYWDCDTHTRSVYAGTDSKGKAQYRSETYQTCGWEYHWVKTYEQWPPVRAGGRIVATQGYGMLGWNEGSSSPDTRWRGFHGGDEVTVVGDLVNGKVQGGVICASNISDCVLATERGAGAGWYLGGIFLALLIWGGAGLLAFWVWQRW